MTRHAVDRLRESNRCSKRGLSSVEVVRLRRRVHGFGGTFEEYDLDGRVPAPSLDDLMVEDAGVVFGVMRSRSRARQIARVLLLSDPTTNGCPR